MSRRKRDPAIAAWSGVAHARIRHEVTDSPAWRVLSYSAKALYTDLRAKLRSTNNGNVNATLSEMKHRGWRSSATLSKALRELEQMGFIAKTRQGGIAAMSRVCSLYRFTDLEVHEHPKQGIPPMKASFDWRRFESVKAAEAELKRLSYPPDKKQKGKSKVQKVKLIGLETESMDTCIASGTEQAVAARLQKLNKEKQAQTRVYVGGRRV